MIYTEYEADELWLEAESLKPALWWETPELLPHEQQEMAEMAEFCNVGFAWIQAMAGAIRRRDAGVDDE